MMSHSALLLALFSPDTYIYIGWGGLLLLTALAYLLIRRTHRRWLRVVTLTAGALFWWIFIWGTYFGPRQLEVVRIELMCDDLPKAFDGYRIVHFSDAHVGSFTGSRQQLLQNAVDSINAQQADMVVFTGDIQNKVPDEIAESKHILGAIKARDGVFSVLGNHDYPMYLSDCTSQQKQLCLHQTKQAQTELGWTLLLNSSHTLHRDSDSIVIAGMENDGQGRFPELGDMKSALDGVDSKAFVVMLEHDPSAWKRKILPYRQRQPQITLSGHTHGGQLSLLGLSPAALMTRQHRGLYNEENRYLYVSKGLGGVIPFRFGAQPEITVLTLRCKR